MANNHVTAPASTRQHRAGRQVRGSRNLVGNGNGTHWPSERGPPTCDEIFPPAPALVSRPLVRARPSPPEGMDPLVAAMWHNENLSLLHSLPGHLLVKIIGMLGNSGVECIRRVARRFPPLCVREIPSPLLGENSRLSETGPFQLAQLRNQLTPPTTVSGAH